MATSYAYDPRGRKVEVEIRDGKTYTKDGSRIGTGYTVQTGGGIYKMTDKGGVKVDSHNTRRTSSRDSDDRRTSSRDSGSRTSSRDRDDRRTSSRDSGSRTSSRDRDPRRDIADTLANTESNIGKIGDNFYYDKSYFDKRNSDTSTYMGSNNEFAKKYEDVINNFYNYNKEQGKEITSQVALDMFKSNLEQSLRGNTPMYKGGGVMSTEAWNEALEDYKRNKDLAYQESKDKEFTDVSGRTRTGKDILDDLSKNVEGEYRVRPEYADLGKNKSGKTQEELRAEWEDLYNGNVEDSPELTGYNGIDQALANYTTERTGNRNTRDDDISRIINSLPDEVLSWADAKARADEQMGYEYDKALEDTLKAIDRQALQTGFFGQLPTMDYKQRNADDIERARAMNISQLAQQLMNDSEQDALNKANSLMGLEAHRDNLTNSEWRRLFEERAYQDGRSDTAWEKDFKEREYADRRDDIGFEKAVTKAQLTGMFEGNPTMALTQLAHNMGMDSKKMEMAETEMNHKIALDFEKLKDDRVALSQAWARIGNTRDRLSFDQAKYMSGIKETAFDMAIEDMANRGMFDKYEDSFGELEDGSWGIIPGSRAFKDTEIQDTLDRTTDSYLDYLLGRKDHPGNYEN